MVLITKYKQNFSSFVRTIKLFILAWYIAWVARRGYDFTAKNTRSIIKIRIALRICSMRDYFVPRENLTLIFKKYYPAGTSLNAIVTFAWLCEKMDINLKIETFRTIFYLFENNVLALTEEAERLDQNKIEFSSLRQHNLLLHMGYTGTFFISSEYGHKIISKLSVKEYLIKSANLWFDKYIKGNWVAVHYRGTDTEARKAGNTKWRYRINLEPYVTYLKSVLDNKCSIFVCSDQAQFIDKMRIAFPGRVFARDIERSHDSLPLHRWGKDYAGEHQSKQEEDALIDILILAKADLIYTTGSAFVDVARYFNPKIKIVSMDGRRIGRGKNNVPMPRKDLFEKLSIPL